MTTHRVMTRQHGDMAITFDPDAKDEVQIAMERFKELVGNQKMWAVEAGKDGKESKLVKEFNPHVDLMFMPQLVGG